jgi:hypothetical protein
MAVRMTAKTPAQRKAAERDRRWENDGLKEVRGIWAPPAEHDQIRAMVAKRRKPMKPNQVTKTGDSK